MSFYDHHNVILFVYPIKFVFSCLSYSGRIGSGTNRFGFNLVRVNSGSGQFGFDSGHIGFWVNSVYYSFGSVRFWVGSISDFGSKSVQLFLVSVRVWLQVVRFGSLLPGLAMSSRFLCAVCFGGIGKVK